MGNSPMLKKLNKAAYQLRKAGVLKKTVSWGF